MKGIVFAAGVGSRLKPFTDFHPKALAPVGGMPALEHAIRRIVDAGADAIVVNVHHFPEQIREFLSSLKVDVQIEISDESDMLLETGGALAKMWRESEVLKSLADDEPVIVHNADVLTDFDLRDFAALPPCCDGRILVNPNRKTTRYFLFDKKDNLCGWTNVSTGQVRPPIPIEGLTMAAFGGVHALTKKVLQKVSQYCGADLHPFGIVDFYLDTLQELNIEGYVPDYDYRWFDIGTSEKLAIADAAYRK